MVSIERFVAQDHDDVGASLLDASRRERGVEGEKSDVENYRHAGLAACVGCKREGGAVSFIRDDRLSVAVGLENALKMKISDPVSVTVSSRDPYTTKLALLHREQVATKWVVDGSVARPVVDMPAEIIFGHILPVDRPPRAVGSMHALTDPHSNPSNSVMSHLCADGHTGSRWLIRT